MFIRNLLKTLLQIFCEFLCYSKAIFKGIIDTDDTAERLYGKTADFPLIELHSWDEGTCLISSLFLALFEIYITVYFSGST